MAQERVGSRERALRLGAMNIHSTVPTRMRAFFESLDFVIAAVLDARSMPQAFLVAGGPDSIESPTPARLALRVPPGQIEWFSPDTAIGLLGIAPDTGQRVRANGRVACVSGLRAEVEVFQCFGNCPRHIHPRQVLWAPQQTGTPPTRSLSSLDERARRLVSQADTFFIASCHPSATYVGTSAPFGLDVSHRGGPPGFVQCDETGRVLTVPDYNGNSYFNTVGNLVCHPHAGMLFIDFEHGDLLQLTVQAEVLWGATQAEASQPQSSRQLRLTLTEATLSPRAAPLRWLSLAERYPKSE